MTLPELKAHADRLHRNGYKFSDFLTDYHARVAFPFTSMIIAWTGVALSLRMRRERGEGIAVLVGLSLLVAFFYLTAHSLALALGRGGALVPMLAGWFSNFVILFLGGYLLLKVRY